MLFDLWLIWYFVSGKFNFDIGFMILLRSDIQIQYSDDIDADFIWMN